MSAKMEVQFLSLLKMLFAVMEEVEVAREILFQYQLAKREYQKYLAVHRFVVM
jgi:hypothetical protein